MCSDGCNLKVNYQGLNYYYMIIYKDNSYRLNLIKDNHVIVSSENLGESINQAYFKIYNDNLFIVRRAFDFIHSFPSLTESLSETSIILKGESPSRSTSSSSNCVLITLLIIFS